MITSILGVVQETNNFPSIRKIAQTSFLQEITALPSCYAQTPSSLQLHSDLVPNYNLALVGWLELICVYFLINFISFGSKQSLNLSI